VLALWAFEGMQLEIGAIRLDAEQPHGCAASGARWTFDGIGMLGGRLVSRHDSAPVQAGALSRLSVTDAWAWGRYR
jgi:hypothetical protein